MSSPELYPQRTLPRQYSFGDFTLDLETGFLRRGAEEVALRPKPFEVLVFLVENHGRLVSKTELTEAVWPDTAVMDNSLSQCLVEIRRALGDDAQQWIRTVARRGYVFTAPVSAPAPKFARPAVDQDQFAPSRAQPVPATRNLPQPRLMAAAIALPLLAAFAGLMIWLTRASNQDLTYTQITNFTDSALSPALSPDGRMIAFFRSDKWFLTTDQIYVKLLPNGEPVQITHDPRQKYGIAFSPDGSRIAYTAVEAGPTGWKTFTLSPLGGEPKLFLSNASGLTWLDDRRVVFAELAPPGSMHMGIVTATENRLEYRRVYFPQDERGMAHFAFVSPNRKWALVAEMNPVWQRCRLIPLDGSSLNTQVGPDGACTAAAWSPDGKWMYFGAEVEGQHHLWRQRFPAGNPQQITSGLTEEDGIAIAADGRSLITSIGMGQSALWLHDSRGESALSSEGFVISLLSNRGFGSTPRFSPNGKSLYWLKRESPQAGSDLWRTDLESEKSEPLLRGISILEFDISDDGKEVIFSTRPSGKSSQLWLATLDRSLPPRLLSSSGEDMPHFGPEGEIVYRLSDGRTHYLARMSREGSGRAKIAPYPIGNVASMSPDRRWIITLSPSPNGGMDRERSAGTLAIPVSGGAPRWICLGCGLPCAWGPDGKYFYVAVQQPSRTSPGKTFAIPVAPGETLPKLPAAGIRGVDIAAAFPGARVIEGWAIAPGPDPSVYAYVKTTMHRNLFRIPLRNQ